MPTSVIYAIGAGIAGGFSAGVWVGFAWSAFAAALVVGIAMKALTPKPRTQVQSEGRMVTVRQPVAPWEFVLGRVRKAGVLTFRYISPDRRFWHMVITLASHECAAIDEIYADGERVVLNSAGFAQGKFAKTGPSDLNEHDTTVPGSPYQVTVPTTVTGVHSVYIEAYNNGAQYALKDVSPAAPASFWEFSRSGSTFTFHSSATGKPVSIGTFDTTDDSWVRIKLSLGDEGPTAQPFPELVAESNGRWTNDHRQYGHCKVYIRLEAKPEVFPNGVPNFTFTIRGAKDVYDPRTAGSGWSANAALCVNWYLTNSEVGPGYDYDEEINEPDLIAAANDCDDAITLLTGGTEPRYETNGAALSSDTPKTVLEQLLAACAGTLVDLGDSWRINVGVYHTPTVTLAEADTAGPSTINAHAPAREVANGVKGIFTSPQRHWQPTDFPPVRGTAYLAEDGGVRHWDSMDLTGFVTSPNQAQRLAKIRLLRMRQALTEEGTFKLAAWGAVPGKSVARTDTQLGWAAKAFEVLDSELAIVEGEGGPVLAVKMQLRETAPAVYDWSTSDETAEDLAPNTNLPDAGVVPVPGTPAILEELVTTRDGRGVAVLVTMSWTASDYPFGANYRPEYKLSSESEWTVLPVTRATSVEVLDVAPGRYDFRVQAIAVNLYAVSEYSTRSNVEIAGLTAAPSAPTGFSIQAGGGTARLKFDPSPDLDVLRGGRVLVRFCHETVVSPSWERSFSIGEPQGWPGDATQIDVPLKPGTYFIKFEDSTGHESMTAAGFETKQASLLAFSSLAALQFDSLFEGTYSGTANVDGQLSLGGLGLWDDIPDVDAEADIDGYGGIATTGTWTAGTGTDLGSVKNVRVTSRVEGVVDFLLDTIDQRTGNVDDWLDWDGATLDGSACDAWLEVRETDDDPAGSPTWSAWKRVDAAEFAARGLQYRAVLQSFDVAYRPLVDVLRVSVEEVI